MSRIGVFYIMPSIDLYAYSRLCDILIVSPVIATWSFASTFTASGPSIALAIVLTRCRLWTQPILKQVI